MQLVNYWFQYSSHIVANLSISCPSFGSLCAHSQNSHGPRVQTGFCRSRCTVEFNYPAKIIFFSGNSRVLRHLQWSILPILHATSVSSVCVYGHFLRRQSLTEDAFGTFQFFICILFIKNEFSDSPCVLHGCAVRSLSVCDDQIASEDAQRREFTQAQRQVIFIYFF